MERPTQNTEDLPATEFLKSVDMKLNSPLRGNIGKMLLLPKANPFPEVIGTFMGRDALSLAVSLLDLGANDTVLLPAYLCREVLKPFLGKTRVEFYDIKPDLTVDPEEIKPKLDRNKVKMLMIINYFGFLQPYRKEVKQICEDKGAVLIEDCAHSLLTEGSGDIGDIAIYSFRKILPLPDGGGLKINGREKPVCLNFYPKIYSNILSLLASLKSLANVRSETLSRAGLSSQKKNFIPSSSQGNKGGRILPLSSFAYNGMGNISFPEIIERRRNDYQFWLRITKGSDRFMPIFDNLPSGVCPLGFPVKVKGRDLLLGRLQKEGIFLKVYWHLHPVVAETFVTSRELASQVCTLPVYPELGQREREGIEELLLL